KPFEVRMAEKERRVVAGIMMCLAEGFRAGPVHEILVAPPQRVRGVERVVLRFRPRQEMELHEAGHLVEMARPVAPDVLEPGFRTLGDLETVHGDVHESLL